MKAAKVQEICRKLPGATEEVLWEDNLVFKVGGKMFTVTGLQEDSRYSFKCPDDMFDVISQLPGIIPAPYLARAKWVQIDPASCELGDEQIETLVRQSYDVVFARLPKKMQKTIK